MQTWGRYLVCTSAVASGALVEIEIWELGGASSLSFFLNTTCSNIDWRYHQFLSLGALQNYQQNYTTGIWRKLLNVRITTLMKWALGEYSYAAQRLPLVELNKFLKARPKGILKPFFFKKEECTHYLYVVLELQEETVGTRYPFFFTNFLAYPFKFTCPCDVVLVNWNTRNC